MRSQLGLDHDRNAAPRARRWYGRERLSPLAYLHRGFERRFERFREIYRNTLAWTVYRPIPTCAFFVALIGASFLLFPALGMDFFPQVDAGQMRLHVRAPPATRIEDTQRYFASVERAIREIVGDEQIGVLLDNIGLPYSATNTGLSDAATIGTMDGEILVSLAPKHTPTPQHIERLRHELPRRFPNLQFFFQPADIVNQVLNFGRQAPIDIRVSGPQSDEAYAFALRLARDFSREPGIVDSHVYQVPDAPALTVDVDRALAQELGLAQQTVARGGKFLRTARLKDALSGLQEQSSPERIMVVAQKLLGECLIRAVHPVNLLDLADDYLTVALSFLSSSNLPMASLAMRGVARALDQASGSIPMENDRIENLHQISRQIASQLSVVEA